MGLTFHRSDSFNKKASSSGTIDDVKGITAVHQWKSTVFETEFQTEDFNQDTYNRNIYGLNSHSPECERL